MEYDNGLYQSLIARNREKDLYGLGGYGSYLSQDGSAINGSSAKDLPVVYKAATPNTGSNGSEPSLLDTAKGWFTPQGESGTSLGGNVLSGIGTAVGIGSGLAGMYYANKKAKLDEERAKMEKDAYNRGVKRDLENENRMQKFAQNAGNNAFYK